MTALDTLNFPALESVFAGAAGMMNSIYLPAATAGSVGAALAALPCALALVWLVRRLTARRRASGTWSDSHSTARFDDLCQRLQTMELLLADATSETAQLRQRVDQLTSKQESLAAGNSRSTLRQAIALSKHGATTRQLIDTCSLSQGEAHLIQNLYGRPPGDAQPDELH